MPTARRGEVKIYTDALVGAALPPADVTRRKRTSEEARRVDVASRAGYGPDPDPARNHPHLSTQVSN